jgi:hypothetical protein
MRTKSNTQEDRSLSLLDKRVRRAIDSNRWVINVFFQALRLTGPAILLGGIGFDDEKFDPPVKFPEIKAAKFFRINKSVRKVRKVRQHQSQCKPLRLPDGMEH